MSVELIIIDLDGTLLRSDSTVGKRTIDAIGKAKGQSVAVSFATGRMVSASKKYAKMLNINLPMVALNGTLVKGIDGAKPIFHRPIAESIFKKLLPELARSEATITIVLGDSSFGWNIDENIRSKLSSWIVGIQDIEPEQSPAEPTIAMVAGDEKPVRQTYEKIVKLGIDDIHFFLFPSIRYYPMWYMEIRSSGTDKGAGVEALQKYLGIAPENTLVIGDYVNDLPMFEKASVCATVSNAHQNIIDIADYVSPLSCDQDGVGEIIEKFVLEK
ncbi:Cof-type HAD-IIB family hydrolase [bacterium]|nr:Cof-type HAD-IIB family hydrolase [bacterium]